MFCAQCISRLWTLAELRIAIRCLRCGIYEDLKFGAFVAMWTRMSVLRTLSNQ